MTDNTIKSVAFDLYQAAMEKDYESVFELPGGIYVSLQESETSRNLVIYVHYPDGNADFRILEDWDFKATLIEEALEDICLSVAESAFGDTKVCITSESAEMLLNLWWELGGIPKTAFGEYVICHENGWFSLSPDEAAADLQKDLAPVDMIRGNMIALGLSSPPIPDLLIRAADAGKDYAISFDDETALGEPQAWIYFKDGSSAEITHEENGLEPEKQYFSLRHHCSEEDFDNDVYHETMGVIEDCSGGLADIAPMLQRLADSGIVEYDTEDSNSYADTLRASSDWISVDEKLPDSKDDKLAQPVLIGYASMYKGEVICYKSTYGCYFAGTWYNYRSKDSHFLAGAEYEEKVLAWMPIPEFGPEMLSEASAEEVCRSKPCVIIKHNFDGDTPVYTYDTDEEACEGLRRLYMKYLDEEISNNSSLIESDCFCAGDYAKISWTDGCTTEFVLSYTGKEA